MAKLIWHTPAGSGEVHLPRDAASAIIKDVNKDGEPELVIFAKPPLAPPEHFEDSTMTWLVGLEPKSKKPLRMWRLENQILGATDEASLTRQLGTVGTFDLTPRSSPVRIIARLPDATPSELQALVGTSGLKLCRRQAQKIKCKKIMQKSIDAKTARRIVDTGGEVGEWEPDPTAPDSPEVLQPPSCAPVEKAPTRVNCGSSMGGPVGGEWIFETVGGALRLVEVRSWAEDS